MNMAEGQNEQMISRQSRVNPAAALATGIVAAAYSFGAVVVVESFGLPWLLAPIFFALLYCVSQFDKWSGSSSNLPNNWPFYFCIFVAGFAGRNVLAMTPDLVSGVLLGIVMPLGSLALLLIFSIRNRRKLEGGPK